MDVQKELSLEEVENFFSICGEYKVEKLNDSGSIKLSYTNGIDGEIYTKLMYKPSIQTLIRDINSLGWRSAKKE